MGGVERGRTYPGLVTVGLIWPGTVPVEAAALAVGYPTLLFNL